MDHTILNEKFVAEVKPAVEEIWRESLLGRAALSEPHYKMVNGDAIGYCLDHEMFATGAPEVQRLVHRVIDFYGRQRVTAYLNDKIALTQ